MTEAQHARKPAGRPAQRLHNSARSFAAWMHAELGELAKTRYLFMRSSRLSNSQSFTHVYGTHNMMVRPRPMAAKVASTKSN
jgi:hypothetical protein